MSEPTKEQIDILEDMLAFGNCDTAEQEAAVRALLDAYEERGREVERLRAERAKRRPCRCGEDDFDPDRHDACYNCRQKDFERAEQAEARLEEGQNIGAELMLAQMVKAVESGGHFSDPRANDFVDAKARLARVVEAGARLRRHVELLLPRDLGGVARQQVIKDLNHWAALAAAQPEEKSQ